LKKLYALCQKTIIITAGELGSIIYDGKEKTYIPALPIKAVDVTGAGDIYRGGFAYGILQEWDLKKTAAFGNLVAGLQCTKIGNACAIPTKSEIDNTAIVSEKTMNLQVINNLFLQHYE
jgi:ribokinase